MFILYDLIFIIFALCYLPIYIFKRKFHPGFLIRLGIFPKEIKKDLFGLRPIWMHAVSVGEVQASKRLIEELRQAYPQKRIIISTVTPAGNKIARVIAGERDFVFYLPLDISFIVRYVVSVINPSLFIIAETEIWPNLIACLYKQNIPIVTVNARISDGSFKGYRLIKILLKPILDKINLFCVQTETDAGRFRALGARDEMIRVTGNMKFDTTDYTDKMTADYTDYRLKIGLKDDEKLLVAGSTHHGEEKIILEVYKELLNGFPGLKLLIAPRHPERAKEIEKLALNNSFNSVFISKLERTMPAGQAGATVFILDTIGQLISFYAIADIVFVGGSLIKKGGHNILEPAAFSKPILFGPYMFNFRDVADLFLKNQSCLLVYNKEELARKIRDLLNNPLEARRLASGAQGLILQNQGATKRNLECIKIIFIT